MNVHIMHTHSAEPDRRLRRIPRVRHGSQWDQRHEIHLVRFSIKSINSYKIGLTIKNIRIRAKNKKSYKFGLKIENHTVAYKIEIHLKRNGTCISLSL